MKFHFSIFPARAMQMKKKKKLWKKIIEHLQNIRQTKSDYISSTCI